MIKASEIVRRLEDSIESLRTENKKLRDGIEPSFDERDEIIDHQKWEISKLTTELSARLKQVEDLQSSYKTLQKENERLKSKLKQTVDEYDEDYQTFHRDDFVRFDENFRKIFGDFLGRDPF